MEAFVKTYELFYHRFTLFKPADKNLNVNPDDLVSVRNHPDMTPKKK
jgi:hypothetical protein